MGGVGAAGDMFDILRKVDTQSRFSKMINMREAMEFTTQTEQGFSPVAGYGVPSTKFSIVFNTESNHYRYVVKTKELLESMKKSRVSKEDKIHYELLLKKVNSSLKVQ
jgi:hypothetical protein